MYGEEFALRRCAHRVIIFCWGAKLITFQMFAPSGSAAKSQRDEYERADEEGCELAD